MNYTPNDLQNITFKKGIMGYNEDNVNEVLDRIIEDYNSYVRENIELKDRLAILNDGMMHYKKIEESLQSTLLIAQQTGEEVKKNAYSKADNIIKDAEIRAHKIINDANQEVFKIRFEYDDMYKKIHLFKTRSETLIMSQLDILKQMFRNEEVEE